MVEFVSANPTGPMHVGHARNAAYGDALARMLELRGAARRARVLRQRRRLAGAQVRRVDPGARARRGGRPRTATRASTWPSSPRAARRTRPSATRRELGRAAVAMMVERDARLAGGVRRAATSTTGPTRARCTRATRARWRTRSGAARSEHGHTYTQRRRAVAAHAPSFGDDKDRVLVRSNGEHTYFASDIAYHQDKRERGFERQIDVWGADHHGYVLRMKAAYAALGGDPDELELLIMQLVHLRALGRARADVKARGRVRHARGARRGDRRRRRALVPARALARHDRRPRPRPGARAVQREPRLLRAVRARADRLDARRRPGRASGVAAAARADGRGAAAPSAAARQPSAR